MFTYAHVGMDDLLKKLPEHWRTAFMCLAAVGSSGEGSWLHNARGGDVYREGLSYFRKIIVCKCSKDPDRAFAVEVVKQMRVEDFELLFNDLIVSMRRDRGSYVDEYAPDGMQMQHPRADTVNIDWRRLPWESASITPINTGIWEGAVNAVFRPDFVFPLSIVQGRLVTCTWTEAVSANTAGMGRRAARDGRC
eukprot:jgi/Tetstr1/428475/TSEL_018486.t1